MARVFKCNTTTANLGISASSPLVIVSDPGSFGTGFMGITATNTTGQAYYIKLYWTGQQNLSYAQMTNLVTNAVATIVPAMTLQVPTTGLNVGIHSPVINQGQLYLWAVSTAADATNTSLSSGGDAISVFID